MLELTKKIYKRIGYGSEEPIWNREKMEAIQESDLLLMDFRVWVEQNRDLCIEILNKTKAREEVLKDIGDFKYFLDMEGFSHTIDGFDEYFKENEEEAYIFFNLTYAHGFLRDEIENFWNDFFYEQSFSEVINQSYVNIQDQKHPPFETPVILEWIYESYYDEWNGDYDSNSECISIKAIFDRTPGETIMLDEDLIYNPPLPIE